MDGGGGRIARDQAEGNPGGITAQSLGKQGLEWLETTTAVGPTIPRTNSARGTRHGQGAQAGRAREGDKTCIQPPLGTFDELFSPPRLQAFESRFEILGGWL